MERVFASLFLVVLGVGTVIFSFGYGIGSATAPQAGYFPLLVGILLAVLSSLTAVREFARRHEAGPGPWPVRQLSIIIVAIVVFGVMMGGGRSFGIPRAGLLPATFFLVLISSRATSRIGLRESGVLAAVLTVVAWVVFTELLGLAVPLWPWSY